jgi:hypothetical protein
MADAQEAVDGGRRWYHLRPEPRRRSDLMGFNSTWWMVLIWALIIVPGHLTVAVVVIPRRHPGVPRRVTGGRTRVFHGCDGAVERPGFPQPS